MELLRLNLARNSELDPEGLDVKEQGSLEHASWGEPARHTGILVEGDRELDAPTPAPYRSGSGMTDIDASHGATDSLPFRDSSPQPAPRAVVRLCSGLPVPSTRYCIIRWLGEGGMGQVFEAEHLDIQRRVALKVFRTNRGHNEAARRDSILSEARACAQVESRFVVRIYDFGLLPDDRPYFAMELLGQTSLRAALRDGPLPLERALPILRQLCKALVAIHGAGLVHRDIKPQNILLQEEEGRADTVRVVDFGIAATPGACEGVVGTPTYMAPEQIRADLFDHRLDLYAFGVVAYELLTGVAPFVGSKQRVFDEHLEGEAESILIHRPGLPAVLDELIQTCLAKCPEQRWVDAHALEAALCEVQIVAGVTTPWDDLGMPEIEPEARAALAERMPRPRSRSLRRRWLVGVASILGLALGITLGVTLGQERGPEPDAPAEAAASRVDELTESVRLAASRAQWVYPSAADPSAPTALHWILALESLEPPFDSEGHVRATELRSELADTLTRLGDKYWDLENGRSFALEFYGLALIFEPTHARASQRTALTSIELAGLRQRAARGEYTSAELRAAALIVALAETNDAALRERLADLDNDPELAMSLSTREALAGLVHELSADLPSDSHGAVKDAADTDTGDTEVGSDGSELEGAEEPKASDPAAARRRVLQAQAALTAGQVAKASRLFHEAVALDEHNAEALRGLAAIDFEDGRYRAALGFARAAARERPRDAELHMLVGDCNLKVLRYPAARRAYERAEALGHPRARERLRYLDELTG